MQIMGMHTSARALATVAGVIAALAGSATAFAGTRAQASRNYAVAAAPGNGAGAAHLARGKENPGRDSAGPKDGFKPNHGREVAEYHANPRAPFKSNGC